MPDLTTFIIPLLIVLVFNVVLSITHKDTTKVDKGFKLNYFRLSYRRKMIRTLTTLPIVILVLIVLYADWGMLVNVLFGIIFLIIFTDQLIYNFKMWTKNEA